MKGKPRGLLNTQDETEELRKKYHTTQADPGEVVTPLETIGTMLNNFDVYV